MTISRIGWLLGVSLVIGLYAVAFAPQERRIVAKKAVDAPVAAASVAQGSAVELHRPSPVAPATRPLAELQRQPAAASDTVQVASAADAQIALADRLDEVLRRETLDPEWEQSLRDNLGTSGLTGLSMEKVECGTSVCRANLRFADEESREQLIAALNGAQAFIGGESFVLQRPGEELDRLTAYVSRLGLGHRR